jgi:hypothetical protein
MVVIYRYLMTLAIGGSYCIGLPLPPINWEMVSGTICQNRNGARFGGLLFMPSSFDEGRKHFPPTIAPMEQVPFYSFNADGCAAH